MLKYKYIINYKYILETNSIFRAGKKTKMTLHSKSNYKKINLYILDIGSDKI